jgi:hypothetical protein
MPCLPSQTREPAGCAIRPALFCLGVAKDAGAQPSKHRPAEGSKPSTSTVSVHHRAHHGPEIQGRAMEIANLNSASKPHDLALGPDRSVVTNNRDAGNYRHNVSDEERALGDAAVEEIERQRRSFDGWVCIGHAVVAFRHRAEIIGRRRTFMEILEERRIVPPLDKGMISRLERMMKHLDEVQKWRAICTKPQRIAWSSPQSIIQRCPVFRKPEPVDGAPPKLTRSEKAEQALSEALGREHEKDKEIARLKQDNSDFRFRRQDKRADVYGGLKRTFSKGVLLGLAADIIKDFGTRKQREAFGLKDDGEAQ